MKRSIYLFVSRTIYASIHFYLATHQAISISLNLPSLSSVSGITHSLRFQTPQPRVQSSSNATSGVLAWLNVWPDLDKGGQNPYLYSDSKMMLKRSKIRILMLFPVGSVGTPNHSFAVGMLFITGFHL